MTESSFGYTEGTGINVAAYSFVEDGKTKQIERVYLGTGILSLPITPQVSGEILAGTEYPSGESINIEGRGRLVLKTLFSDPDESMDLRIKYMTSGETTIGYSDKATVTNLQIADPGQDGFYFGDLVVANNEFGAGKFKIRALTSVSGEVRLFAGGL